VEVKNYNADVRNKFDSEAGIIPAADMAQLVHEATVHNISDIVLAVLFGDKTLKCLTVLTHRGAERAAHHRYGGLLGKC
jgi:hypothetical protein